MSRYLVKRVKVTDYPHAWRWNVTGSGIFPFDMLRLDRCHPVGPDDAQSIGLCPYAPRSVTLVSDRLEGGPAPLRWKLRGWVVSDARNLHTWEEGA